MPDYSKMTQKDFDNILQDICNTELFSASQWLSIPGIYEIMAEYFNNEVLEQWTNNNQELAYPEEQEEE